MKSLRLSVLLVVFAMLTISVCAADNQAPMKPDEMSSLKGQSAKSVVDRLGQPSRKSTDSNGNQVWEYKTPAAAQQGKNTFYKISSFGIYSGEDSVYVDVLRITFLNGKVVNFAYDENVLNISIPGTGNTQAPPPVPVTAELQPKASDVIKEPSKPINEAPVKKTVVIAPEVKPATESNNYNFVATVKSSKKYFNSKSRAIYNKLVASVENKELRIVSKVKGRLVIASSQGINIEATVKQVRKDVVVELNTTGVPASAMIFQDFSEIYNYCN